MRGGGHTTGAPACETTAKRFDPEKAFLVYGGKEPKKGVKYDGRAQMVVFMEALHRAANSLGICIQTTAWFSLDYMAFVKWLSYIRRRPAGKLSWKIDPAKYNRMLDEYYDLRGWDRETSYPTRKTLEDFGARRCGQ